MTLRRPAAHLRRPPCWRRSGDESYWESLMSEGETLPGAPHPRRAARPQSAIEGGQLDGWLEHLQRMQSDLLRTPVQVPAFHSRTAPAPAYGKEQSARRQRGIPSFSGGSSSCGSPSLCESSLGSQESFQTGFFSPPERRGSRERAHITQAPRKEQAQLSHLAPVKIGWLPIQRKVMMLAESCSPSPFSEHSAGQVKVKQPITPTVHHSRATANSHRDGEVERGHAAPSASGLRTWQPWQTHDHGPPVTSQVPERRSAAADKAERPVSWQALRRGWGINRLPVLPAGGQSKGFPAETNPDPYAKAASAEPHRHPPLRRTTSAEPCAPRALLRGAGATESHGPLGPLSGASSVQPARSAAAAAAAHIQTSSAATTLIPQSKAGISSITISSRRVSRSASLCGPGEPRPPHEPMDPSSRQVMVQRKATIVKVTEQRLVSSPAPSTKSSGAPPASGHLLDTVVHRRKATIIKVTEHKESFGPVAARPGSRHPQYRHSYTDGLYKENSSMWSHGNHSEYGAAALSRQRPSAPTSDPEKTAGATHTSTLRLFVSSPPVAPAGPWDPPPRAAEQRSSRPHRPLSCYGSVSRHAEGGSDGATQPAAGTWRSGLQQGSAANPVYSGSSSIGPGSARKVAGQPAADELRPNRGEAQMTPPPADAARRSSPSLALITAPDPQKSPEEVLALNAAAIIANIKLQRQLSKKKTPNGRSEKAPPPEGNAATGERERAEPGQSRVQERHPQHQQQQQQDQQHQQHQQQQQQQQQHQQHQHQQPGAASAPPGLEPGAPGASMSLQEALQRSRPHFIVRSQGRVQELERRAQERRETANLARPQPDGAPGRGPGARHGPPNDNLFRPRDAAVSGRETQPRPKRALADVRRRREEEKKREACLSNRQRMELFKKKLLDQILQRGNN